MEGEDTGLRPKKLEEKEKEDEKEKLGTWPTIMVSQLFRLSFVRSLALVVSAVTFSTFFSRFHKFPRCGGYGWVGTTKTCYNDHWSIVSHHPLSTRWLETVSGCPALSVDTVLVR